MCNDFLLTQAFVQRTPKPKGDSDFSTIGLGPLFNADTVLKALFLTIILVYILGFVLA